MFGTAISSQASVTSESTYLHRDPYTPVSVSSPHVRKATQTSLIAGQDQIVEEASEELACSSDSLQDSFISSADKKLTTMTKQSNDEYLVSSLTDKENLDSPSSVSSSINANENCSILNSPNKILRESAAIE